MHWRRKWQPTPVFLPGESRGWGSLVGCRLWGHTVSDTTEVTWRQQQQFCLSTEVYTSCTEVSLCRARLSNTEKAEGQAFWVVLQMGRSMTSPSLLSEMRSFQVGDKARWLHKFTFLALCLDIYLAS